MKDHHIYHAIQYSIIVIIFLATIPLLFVYKDQSVRLALISGLSLFYFVIGILHHKEENNLTSTKVLEYFAISVLIFVVLFSLFR